MKKSSNLVNIRKAFTRNQRFCIICTSVAFLAVGLMAYRIHIMQENFKAIYDHQVASYDQREIFYENLGDVVEELRVKEFNINRINAAIEAKQLTVEQNIDTSYQILLGKSSRTTNDELIEVIKQRVPTIKETMNTGDLYQAIEVMKENFPAATFAELDNLYQKNIELLSEITKDKEQYNRCVDEYNQLIYENEALLATIHFARYSFKKYELDDDEKKPLDSKTTSPEEEIHPVVDENGAVG